MPDDLTHFIVESMFTFKDVHEIRTILSHEESFVWFKCQGNQRSPGIIPLAVKDAFSIIQETPRREFLLRVSYFEIYNEVLLTACFSSLPSTLPVVLIDSQILVLIFLNIPRVHFASGCQ
jgi:hypothetical protein